MPTRRAPVERKPSLAGSRKREPVTMSSVGVGLQAGEQIVDVARVVLPVAVDLNGDLVAVLERVEVAALHRAADAEVERQAQHRVRRPRPRGRRSSSVEPSSITTHVEVGRGRVDLGDGSGDRLDLVVRGHDDEIPPEIAAHFGSERGGVHGNIRRRAAGAERTRTEERFGTLRMSMHFEDSQSPPSAVLGRAGTLSCSCRR